MNMPAEELIGHLHILSQSVKDFLDPWFESEALKVALATDGVIGTKGGPYTPGTAYVLLHHVMGGVGGKRGLWGFVRGGMGGVTQAMAASARSVGVEIRTGARVAKSWPKTAARPAWRWPMEKRFAPAWWPRTPIPRLLS